MAMWNVQGAKIVADSPAEAARIWRAADPKTRGGRAVTPTPWTAGSGGRMPATRGENQGHELQKLLDAANAHGEASDPEMEAGDLQEILTSCWAELTTAQRHRIAKKHEDLVTEWLE
jgi:hypothetical protein